MSQTYQFKSHGVNVTVGEKIPTEREQMYKYICLIKPYSTHGGVRKVFAQFTVIARSQASAAQQAIQLYLNK